MVRSWGTPKPSGTLPPSSRTRTVPGGLLRGRAGPTRPSASVSTGVGGTAVAVAGAEPARETGHVAPAELDAPLVHHPGAIRAQAIALEARHQLPEDEERDGADERGAPGTHRSPSRSSGRGRSRMPSRSARSVSATSPSRPLRAARTRSRGKRQATASWKRGHAPQPAAIAVGGRSQIGVGDVPPRPPAEPVPGFGPQDGRRRLEGKEAGERQAEGEPVGRLGVATQQPHRVAHAEVRPDGVERHRLGVRQLGRILAPDHRRRLAEEALRAARSLVKDARERLVDRPASRAGWRAGTSRRPRGRRSTPRRAGRCRAAPRRAAGRCSPATTSTSRRAVEALGRAAR